MRTIKDFYADGGKYGVRAGRSVTDGNTKQSEYEHIVDGYELGDGLIMDLCPNPLSGEWAGESISEIFGLDVGEAHPAVDDLLAFEDGFRDAFWETLIKICQTQLEGATK